MLKKFLGNGNGKKFLSAVTLLSTAFSILEALFDDEIRRNETREIVEEILKERK